MAAALVVVGGVAYALTFTCDDPQTDPEPGGICNGTDAPDNITGTSGPDEIHAKAENDTVDALDGIDTVRGAGESDVLHGRDGNDVLHGDGPASDPSRDGHDDIYGEGGQDTLDGEGGDNRYFGGTGPDTIDAAFSFSPEESPNAVDGEIIHGGRGNDDISTKDGLSDIVYCGPGNRDKVSADRPEVDELHDCEKTDFPE
jgi:hypothetical protein